MLVRERANRSSSSSIPSVSRGCSRRRSLPHVGAAEGGPIPTRPNRSPLISARKRGLPACMITLPYAGYFGRTPTSAVPGRTGFWPQSSPGSTQLSRLPILIGPRFDLRDRYMCRLAPATMSEGQHSRAATRYQLHLRPSDPRPCWLGHRLGEPRKP
jgi:hypothetical protein